MFKQIDYTMVVVSDMQRSVEFYRDKLGIPLKFQSPDWTEFQTGAQRSPCMAAVFRRLHLRLRPYQASRQLLIGFNVEDVDRTYVELQEKGIRSLCSHAARGRGDKLAVCIDRTVCL